MIMLPWLPCDLEHLHLLTGKPISKTWLSSTPSTTPMSQCPRTKGDMPDEKQTKAVVSPLLCEIAAERQFLIHLLSF